MTFDDELRDLAGRAAQAHVRSDGFASATVQGRVRRARRVYRTAVVTGSVAAVVLVGVLGTAVAQRWPDPAPPAQTIGPSPETPEPEETPVPPPLSVDGVLSGWGDLGVDPEVFGVVAITDSVTVAGRAVVVGCLEVQGSTSGFPVWFADDAAGWARASGPQGDGTRNVCLDDVVATPHGLFAGGMLGLFHSDDGSDWEQVELPLENGFGTVDAVVAVGDRATVLVSRASLNESTVAELYTTTDGESWTQVTDGSAQVFDNAGIADVVIAGDRLIAVGASPSGQFVPTAAVWVSTDGVAWQLVTPTGAGFEGAAMTAVTSSSSGFAVVGACSFESGLMCAWSSPDGVTWTPEASPTGEVAAEFGYLVATDLTAAGDDLYAVGYEFDASRAEGEQTIPALWRRVSGRAWERVDVADVGVVPFTQTEAGGVGVGFWPGRSWPLADEVRVLTPVDRG